MLPKRGIKRQRSDGLSELALPSITATTGKPGQKPLIPVPNLSAASKPRSSFTVFNDPDADQPRRPKKARLDPLRLLNKAANAFNTDVSPIRLPNTAAPTASAAPSLKDRAAFNGIASLPEERITPPNNTSQRAQAMFFSPSLPQQAASQAPSPTAFLTSRRYAFQQDESSKFPRSPLKSPFRPVFKASNSNALARPALTSVVRRPSEGTALRRTLPPKDTHRRPSDSYALGPRTRPLSFMKNLAPPPGSRITRDPSFLDSLQRPVTKTPPNLTVSLKSPSVLPSSEVRVIPPIPRVTMQLDTPGRDTDQLVADMSQFSLDPKPDVINSSPVQKPMAHSNNKMEAMVVEQDEMVYQPQTTQSSPGIELPSKEDSWCRVAVSQSSPIKSIVAPSSDPIDLFHPIRFPPSPKRFRTKAKARVSGSSFETHSLKRSHKVYGKQRTRKSVHFVNVDEEEEEGRQGLNDMDVSDDELLLK